MGRGREGGREEGRGRERGRGREGERKREEEEERKMHLQLHVAECPVRNPTVEESMYSHLPLE